MKTPIPRILEQKGKEQEDEKKELIEVKLDEHYIEEIYRKELKKRLDELQSQEVFWDMKTLSEKTKISVGIIKDTFFYEESPWIEGMSVSLLNQIQKYR